MRLLLDTHAFIWSLNKDRQLPSPIVNLVKDSKNDCYVSIASLWEIAIKVSLKRLDLESDFRKVFPMIEKNRIEILPITPNQLLKLLKLPLHHRDPFDRIIIAQSQQERLIVITKDFEFNSYKVKTLWD